MRNDDGRNEGQGWDELITPDDERLVRAGRYEKEIPPVFGPLFGSWKITAALFLVFAILALYWVYMQGWFASDTESHLHGAHSHGEANVELPASVAKHVKGGYTHGTMGSPKWYLDNNSFLKQGKKDDSKMVIYDRNWPGGIAVVYGYGCGRGWYKTDPNGFWTEAPGIRETGCNLQFHQTGQRRGDSTSWSRPSYHRD